MRANENYIREHIIKFEIYIIFTTLNNVHYEIPFYKSKNNENEIGKKFLYKAENCKNETVFSLYNNVMIRFLRYCMFMFYIIYASG